jgi:methyl-accepting chemotaxis protein
MRQTSTAVTLALIALLVAVGVGSGFTVQRAAGDLRRIVDELRNGAMGLASSSEEFTSTSRSLANSATQQASAITETTASTSQVRSMAEANRESAEGAAEDMERASRLIGGTVESMGHLTTWIGEVRDSSRKISKIIKAIDEIAMQTNILALNAAVEAARAGEAGAGFGVVADEVRNLAQRCAQAARETTTLIEESILQADKGQRRLEDMAQAVNELTPVADSTRDRVKNVSQASQEQSHSIREVGEALSHLESLTAQVAAGAEESSVTSQELSKQANSLSTVANRLHVIAG